MKILFISIDFPIPPNTGSRIRDLQTLKALAKYHDVYWVTKTLEGEINKKDIDEMQKYCREMIIIPWKHKHSIIKFILSLFTKYPYKILQFKSEKMNLVIKNIINQNQFNLIFCDHLYVTQYLPSEINIPVIASNEDTCFGNFLRLTKSQNILRSLYAKTQVKKMMHYEIKMLRKYGHFITTSENEKKLITSKLSDLDVIVIDNGVDLDYFSPGQRTDFTPTITFIGWYAYYPNKDAVLYFVNKIFPLLKKSHMQIRLYIVGKGASKEIYSLENEDIIVTGMVDDVRKYLANTDVFIVPVRLGGGTKNKILVAWASGVPVVSTSFGAEGLLAVNGKNILVEDNEEGFAERIIEVIKNKELAESLRENGIKLVQEHYDSNKIAVKLNSYIEKIVEINSSNNYKV